MALFEFVVDRVPVAEFPQAVDAAIQNPPAPIQAAVESAAAALKQAAAGFQGTIEASIRGNTADREVPYDYLVITLQGPSQGHQTPPV